MGLKSFFKKYFITIILICCIVFLFWQNLGLKKEVLKINNRIGHITYFDPKTFDPPKYMEVKSASGIYSSLAALDYHVKYLRKDVDLLLDTLKLRELIVVSVDTLN